MEYLLEIIVAVIGAILLGIGAWIRGTIKEWQDLDPDGQIMQSLETWEGHMVEWVLSKAEEQGADLEVPETRSKFINEAVDWFMPKIPKLMDFLNYSKDDLINDVEALVKRALGKIV